MRKVVAADIGGTHARFAMATVDAGHVVELGEAVTLKTAEHDGLDTAFLHFAESCREPPQALAVAFAGPVGGKELRLTNSPWILHPEKVRQQLRLDALYIVNDFEAVAHAVAQLGDDHLLPLCGPAGPLPDQGVITIVGPGTGLGVAALLRRGDGSHDVIATEGGHADFSPLDALEDRMLAELRKSFGRVSTERLLSGPGLMNIYRCLAAIEGREPRFDDQRQLWDAALDGSDAQAVDALERLCMTLGAVAGDLALVHGAKGVVVAGGLGLRLASLLPRSGFGARFTAKGRYQRYMEALPVRLILHPQPGLLGAAAAFAQKHADG